MEGKKGCKIRKRGCSSSSSSSLAQRNRFKRAILAGKRAVRGHGVSGTTVKPTAVAAVAGKSPAFPFSPEKFLTDVQNSSVSARKLAATLWELGKSISSPGNSDRDFLCGKEPARNRVRLPPKMSDPIRHNTQRKEPSGVGSVRTTPAVPQNLQLIDYKTGVVITTRTHDNGKCIDDLEEVRGSLTTSKELVKVLTRVNKLGDYLHYQTARKRLISALRSELDRARSALKRLIREHSHGDMTESFVEEKRRRSRRRMEREVAAERKLRQQTERMNKKLGHELAEAKAETRRLKEEMKRERRAKEILEQVCDELVRGVGDDKAEAERLRKEAERAKEEVEKEREMMHIADVLREERVQMKLTEAKFEFEEKNAAAVERLRSELRRALTAEGKGSSPELRRVKRVLEIIDGGDGSDRESDLKSIELNMDSVGKSYMWSFVGSGQFSGRSHRRETGDDDEYGRRSDGDSEDSVGKRSVIVDFQTGDGEEIEKDKTIERLRDYIMSNMRFVSSSEQWNRITEVSPE